MHDILIKNARVIDGSGAPWFRADVAVKNGVITAVGKVGGEAARVIDASGLVLSPGFIDSHSHSDDPLLKNRNAESKVRQGVTTEVIGQCGASAAPRVDDSAEDEAGFETFAEYLDLLRGKGVSLNVVPLVGHGNIRAAVMGYENRPATAEELVAMCDLAEECMQAGARGFTTGLIYPPGSYADHKEIVAMARAVARHGGYYATHMRDEGADLLASVCESISVGREANIPVQISHHKVCGEANWGLVKDSLEMIDAARAEGIDVTMDQYPYIATATGLKVIIPQWAHSGGKAAMRERLLDPVTGPQIRAEIAATERRWDWLLVASCQKAENKCYEGKTAQEIGEMMGKSPLEASLSLLLDEDFNVGMVRFAMCEEDVERVLLHPAVMIGSDAGARATYGVLSEGKPHPRSYGTFPRVLEKYVRERRVITLEQAVYKMTGLPAARWGLWNRGLIRPGFKADLVLFDPDTVHETATFAEPHAYPQGIPYVLVNGQLVVDGGEHTGKAPGELLVGV
ncbi:MAG TPA: D-aminoacylase [Bacillota bacterium]|nr:D-aminoacylase [Bacillota bacterium]